MVYSVKLRRNLRLTMFHLNHLNAGAGAPDLGSVLAVPPEGEDVLARFQGLRDLHQVPKHPPLSVILSGRVDHCPLRSLGGGVP